MFRWKSGNQIRRLEASLSQDSLNLSIEDKGHVLSGWYQEFSVSSDGNIYQSAVKYSDGKVVEVR